MKTLVLYHPVSELARSVETFQREFAARTGKTVELISLETTEGADKARVYDITQYPAVMVTKDSGELVQVWQGENLPLINEVAGYLTNT